MTCGSVGHSVGCKATVGSALGVLSPPPLPSAPRLERAALAPDPSSEASGICSHRYGEGAGSQLPLSPPFSPQLSWYQVTGGPSCDTGTPDLRRCQQFRYYRDGGLAWRGSPRHHGVLRGEGVRVRVDALPFPSPGPQQSRIQMEALKMGAQGVKLSWQAPSTLWGRGTSPRLMEARREAVTLQACRQVGGGCPGLQPPTCRLPCRPPGHPVQNVLPSTTFTALLSKTFPSAKETCSPLWLSPR